MLCNGDGEKRQVQRELRPNWLELSMFQVRSARLDPSPLIEM